MSKSSKKKQDSTLPVADKSVSSGAGEMHSGASAPADRSAYKVKTPEERKKAHIEGIIKTAVASVIGILAGVLTHYQFGDATNLRWYALLTIIVALSYYALRLVLPIFKIDTKEFGFKDWFYVEFLVVDFCLVAWTMLLN